MPYRSHEFSIEDAIASSQQTYDVDFEGWGWRDPALSPDENMRFPPPGKAAIPTTLSAISIGPKSTVDRCWVSWDRQKNLTIPNDLAVDLTSPVRRLSREAPLLYPQATNRGTLKYIAPGDPLNEGTIAAMQRGLLYVFSYADGVDAPFHDGQEGNTTALPAQFNDQFGVVRTWPNGVGVSGFEPPFLHLVLNLRPGMFSPPVKRFPLNRTKVFSALIAGGAKQLIAMIPIFGRKNVRVQMTSVGTPRICDFYVGLVRNVNESQIGGFSEVREIAAGSALAVPANPIPTGFAIDNPCADYLLLYATTTVGNTSVAYTVTAED
jgi:hypothetical protein